MNDYEALVEFYWHVVTESLEEKPFSVLPRPQQVQHIMASGTTKFPTVSGCRLIMWSLLQPVWVYRVCGNIFPYFIKLLRRTKFYNGSWIL